MTEQTTKGPFVWVPLGLTHEAWVEKLNPGLPARSRHRWPLDQGVLVHFAGKGVFFIGTVGNFYYGQRLPDGSVDTAKTDWCNTNRDPDIIVEYADPPGFKLKRDEDGGLIYPPGWIP